MTQAGDSAAGAFPGDDRLGGVVLCRVGAHRLAFLARQVAVIEVWGRGGRDVPHARMAYALPCGEGRLLLAENGDGVVVDALEVAQEAPPLLPAPQMLVGGAGGALRGFLSIGEELWPVLRLPEFSRFVAALGVAGGAP